METNLKKVASVGMGQKIAFGFGMLANQMFPAALGVFIIVLVQDLGFAALLWGIIQFAPRIFDAINARKNLDNKDVFYIALEKALHNFLKSKFSIETFDYMLSHYRPRSIKRN